MVIVLGGYGLTDMCVPPHYIYVGREKVHTEGTYKAQVVVHGSQVVHNHALILFFLATPGAEGVTTSLT